MSKIAEMLAVRAEVVATSGESITVKVNTTTGEQTLEIKAKELVMNGSSFTVGKCFVEGMYVGHKQACPICDKGNNICPEGKELWDRAERAARES